MDNKIGYHLNGTTDGSTHGNISKNKSYNTNNLEKDNNVRKVDNINYNSRIVLFDFLLIVVNAIFFGISAIFEKYIFNIKGIVLSYSCTASTIVFVFSIFAMFLIISPFSKRKGKKNTTLPPRKILNEESYKKIKKIIFISEFIVLLALCIAVKFFSNITSYNNGTITFNKNTQITKIKVSDIKYINIYCKRLHHSSKSSSYYYLGISADCFCNDETKTLSNCDSVKDLSALTSFLDDIKKNHNFQGVSVSNDDVSSDAGNGTTFKYLSTGKPPVFYIETSQDQLNDIENTDMTKASEKYVNDPIDTKKYSDYINGK